MRTGRASGTRAHLPRQVLPEHAGRMRVLLNYVALAQRPPVGAESGCGPSIESFFFWDVRRDDHGMKVAGRHRRLDKDPVGEWRCFELDDKILIDGDLSFGRELDHIEMPDFQLVLTLGEFDLYVFANVWTADRLAIDSDVDAGCVVGAVQQFTGTIYEHEFRGGWTRGVG